MVAAKTQQIIITKATNASEDESSEFSFDL
jgi:hypothetical protein